MEKLDRMKGKAKGGKKFFSPRKTLRNAKKGKSI